MANKDLYGGLLSRPGTPTGVFHMEQIGDRWYFVTPAGNGMWLRAVYAVSETATSQIAFPGKYPSKPVWGARAVRRLRGWGFNALGEYWSGYASSIPTYGGTTSNPEKLPMIRIVRPSYFCLNNRYNAAAHAVHDIIQGVDTIHNGLYRGASSADLWDPAWEATVAATVADQPANSPGIFRQNLATQPWLLGTSTDEGDNIQGFKRRTLDHLGWMIAVTRPTSTSGRPASIGAIVNYADPIVYSKAEWRNYLANKYGTVAALNSAWGSTYTTFDSSPTGWPLGTGVLDESGRNPWMAPIQNNTKVANPVVMADLDAFLELHAIRYWGTMRQYIKLKTPNHPMFGPAPVHAPQPPILRAANGRVDCLQATVTHSSGMSVEAFLDQITDVYTGPIFLWVTFTSQADSPFAGFPNNWGEYNAPTQAARAQLYSAYMTKVLNYKRNGVYPVAGVNYWSWTDQGGEKVNFGLVSLKDNAYDGREAIIAPGTDSEGFVTGGQVANYGDYLTEVTQCNANLDAALDQAGDTTAPPVPGQPSSVGIFNWEESMWNGVLAAVASEAGEIRLYQNDALVGSAPAAGAGSVTFAVQIAEDGDYAFQVSAVDNAGNESQKSAALNVHLDHVAPPVPGAPTVQTVFTWQG